MESLKISRPSNISEAWWSEVCKKLKNAVVFIEDSVAESLHWTGGLERITNSGCRDVKEFSSFETCRKDDEKAVFLLGGLISGIALDTIRDIIKSSKLKYVIVVSGAHQSVHAYSAFGGREVDERAVMNKLEEQILEWLGNLNYTVEVFYFPLLLVPLSDDVFLLPHFHDIFPIFEDEIPEILRRHLEFGRADKRHIESLDELEFQHLPFAMRTSIYHLIVCLHSYLQGMFAREEIYSIGHLARIVAGELETYNPARQRRKAAANKVSLLFVDRVLDLASPSSFDSSILMSRVLNLLPRLPGHKVDSVVDLSPLSLVHPSCDWTLIPGNLAHPSVGDCSEVLEAAVSKAAKETLRCVNQKVKGVLKGDRGQREDLPLSEQLEENVKMLLTEDKENVLDSFNLVQQALAVTEVMKHSGNVHLDQLYSVQKMLLQCLNDPTPELSPMQQVLQLLRTRSKKELKIEAVLAVLMYLASLGGHDVIADTSEYAFTNALSQAFVEDRDKNCEVLSGIFGGEIDEVSALKTANRVWMRLTSISKARNHLKDYRSLYARGSEMEPYRYRSLISQLVQDCLTPPQLATSDLEYRSAGFKDMIKTGFSLFVNVSKPCPKDAALMIIYVLGGVTPSEVSELKALVREANPSCELLVGSSHLTYSSDIVEQCFKNKFC